MHLLRNATLRPSAFALVTTIERGCSIRGSGETAWRLASDRLHVLAPLTRSERRGTATLALAARPLEPAAPLPADACAPRAGADVGGEAADGWGRGCSPPRSATRTRPSRRRSHATAARSGRARRASPRIATNGPARATCCTWTALATLASSGPGTPSPATARRRAPRAHRRRLRLRGRDRRRLLPARIRRAGARREGGKRGRLHRACARLRRPEQDRAEAAADGQRLVYGRSAAFGTSVNRPTSGMQETAQLAA
jgi:hypothetical protein